MSASSTILVAHAKRGHALDEEHRSTRVGRESGNGGADGSVRKTRGLFDTSRGKTRFRGGEAKRLTCRLQQNLRIPFENTFLVFFSGFGFSREKKVFGFWFLVVFAKFSDISLIWNGSLPPCVL